MAVFSCTSWLTPVTSGGGEGARQRARPFLVRLAHRQRCCQEENRPRVRDTKVVGVPHGVRSKALECVQLAAAFSPASLLAGSPAITEIVLMSPGPANAAFPASELAGQKAAASCTHSKAPLPPAIPHPPTFMSRTLCDSARDAFVSSVDFYGFSTVGSMISSAARA